MTLDGDGWRWDDGTKERRETRKTVTFDDIKRFVCPPHGVQGNHERGPLG